MRSSKFSDNKIIAILNQNEEDVSVPELCREHGMSNATFYKWRAKFGGKVLRPSQRKEMAKNIVVKRQVTIRFACLCMRVSETCYRYQARLSSENELIANWLLRLTQTHKRWGFGLCFMHLRNVKGFAWNHKRLS